MAENNTNEQVSPEPEIEVIPGTAVLTRLIDSPRMYRSAKGLLWPSTFEFPHGEGESVNWDKYAPPPNEVHRLGRAREVEKRSVHPEFTYAGYIPTSAEAVRAIRTARGHGLAVEHVPSEGVHHSEIRYAPNEEAPLHKGDKGELKFALGKVFGPLVACPNDPA